MLSSAIHRFANPRTCSVVIPSLFNGWNTKFVRSFSVDDDDEVTDIENEESFIKFRSSEKPSIMCFSSKANESCKKMSPLFSHFSTMVPEASFVNIDIEKNGEIAKKEEVTTIPCFKLYKSDVLLYNFAGANGMEMVSLIETARNNQ